MPWIFCYAELGPQALEKMLPSAPFCALPATAEGYQVVFKGKNRAWGGGVATLEKKRGQVVYGSVYLVPEAEVKHFDKYHKTYDKVGIKVNVAATGDEFKVITYVIKQGETSAPSGEYSKEILKHLKFFWGQGKKGLSLADFGIAAEEAAPATPTKRTRKPKETQTTE